MKNNEQMENVDSIANDEVEEDDEDDISYANDSLEINNVDNEVDEDPMNNEFNEIDNSYLNYERTNRRDTSELNSVNNTITAVTLINNNNNNMNNLNTAPAEITSSLTSFSSMSSSTTNSHLNTEMVTPKEGEEEEEEEEEEASSMSPSSSSSTASTSPSKFASLLSSCSLNETPKPQSLNIECTFDFVVSSQFNMSSPVYLSSPSSLSCTPITNDLAMKEAIEQQLTNEMNELKCEPVVSKQAPRSAIPIIKTGSSLQHNHQKMIPELGAKFSQLKPKVVRNLYENSLKEIKPIATSGGGSEEKLLIAGIADFYKKATAAAATVEVEIEEEASRVGGLIVSPQPNQHNLHNHVCTIANKCTCEKKFLVDKIGEGKYRIGNTKNIVFIRVSRT